MQHVTCKLIDSNKKEIVQRRNNLLPYYPKEHALRKLTQLYSFTGLKIVHDYPKICPGYPKSRYKLFNTIIRSKKKQKLKKPNQNLKKSAINKYLKTKEKSKTRRKNFTTRNKRKISTTTIITTPKFNSER